MKTIMDFSSRSILISTLLIVPCWADWGHPSKDSGIQQTNSINNQWGHDVTVTQRPYLDPNQKEIDNIFSATSQGPNIKTPSSIESTTVNVGDTISRVFGSNPNLTPTSPVSISDILNSVTSTTPTIPTNNNDCDCVLEFQCKADGTFDKYGENAKGLGPRGSLSLKVPKVPPTSCPIGQVLCCSSPRQTPPLSVVTPPPSITIPPPSTTTPPPPPPSEQKTCGKRNRKGVGFRKISFNQETEFGEFPWMVAVITQQDFPEIEVKRNVYQCGGALIHPQIVLTSAHHVHFYTDNPSGLKIRAGEWDSRMTSEILPHQDRSVKSVIVHENYHKGGMLNNFALLILSRPVDLVTDNVGIVCLPVANETFDNTRCTASGWGKDNSNKPSGTSSVLKRVDLPVVPRDQCQTALRTTHLGTHFELHDSFICAGGEPGKDTCKGDGGSPLVCPMKGNPTKYVQAGIVSWGIDCGLNGIPGVYADVAFGRRWIDDQATKAGFNINEYQNV